MTIKNKTITLGRSIYSNVTYIDCTFVKCYYTTFKDCIFKECTFNKSNEFVAFKKCDLDARCKIK